MDSSAGVGSSTHSLIERARRRVSAAFGELYGQIYADLYRYALYRLGSREEAEDAVQEAALEAFFSQSITKAEMRQMIERYDRESAQLRSRLTAARTRVEATFNKANLELDIRAKASALLLGERASETFYKTILDQMVVYPDRRV